MGPEVRGFFGKVEVRYGLLVSVELLHAAAPPVCVLSSPVQSGDRVDDAYCRRVHQAEAHGSSLRCSRSQPKVGAGTVGSTTTLPVAQQLAARGIKIGTRQILAFYGLP